MQNNLNIFNKIIFLNKVCKNPSFNKMRTYL